MLLLEIFPGLNEKTGHMARATSAGFDPKVWYHATTYDFDEFVPSRWRRASYFADTPEGAIRGAGAGGNEHPALGGPTTDANRTGLQIIPVLIKGKTWGRDPLPLEWFPETILYGEYRKVCRGKSPISIPGVTKREEEYLNYIRQDLFPKIYDEDVPVEEYYNYTGDKEDDLPLRRTRLPIPEPYFSYKDVEGTDNYAVDAMKAIGFENWLVKDEAGTSIAVSNPANIRVKHAAFDPNKLHSPKMNESVGSGYFYHMTDSRNLPSIKKKGLLPGDFDRANWGGEFANGAIGKLFFSDLESHAEYYGNIIKRQRGVPNYFAMLRVPASKLPDIENDYDGRRKMLNDFVLKRKVLPKDIEIKWDCHGWKPLSQANVDMLACGEWDDEEEEENLNESEETFDTDKINVKEVYDSKWNFIRYTFTIPLSHGAEIEAYVIANGDTLEFKDILTKNAKDHPLFHDNGSSSAAYSQTVRLGTAETRRLIRYIFSYVRERHPEIKNISSTRVTGARPASGNRSMDFALPISSPDRIPAAS